MTEESLFAQALELPPEERAAFLDQTCGEDAELRTRIDVLLHSHNNAETVLAESAENDLDATLPVATEEPIEMPEQIPMTAAGANPDSTVPFIFGNRIAQGAMGAILTAEDCKLGRTIAVKVILDEVAVSDEQKLRFIQEAAVLGKLQHPNIVPVYDLGRDASGSLYYSMKLVKGRTLQDIINDLQTKVPESLEHYTLDRLLTIFRKICDALAFAHAEDIIHRDLKPENIMVGEFGEVLVMDWGLSKILDGSPELSGSVSVDPLMEASPSSSVSATLEGSVMGTPQYMSPEQAAGEVAKMDSRSDIYSLGGILYAILTLRPPVEGTDIFEVLAKVQAGDLTPISTLGTTNSGDKKIHKGDVLEASKIKPLPHISGGRVPPALSAVAMKALSLKKKNRYRDVASFSGDIENWQGGFATTAEHAGLMTQIALLIKRNKGVFSTAAAAWVLITALAVLFVLGMRAKERRAVAGEEAAKASEVVAIAEKDKASEALARSAISLAEALMREEKGPEMRVVLKDVPENLRDSSWNYLLAQADTSIAAIETGSVIDSVTAHPLLRHVFAVADQSGKITFLNVLTGERLLEFSPEFTDSPSVTGYRLAISPDGERIAVGRRTRKGLLLHSTRDGRKLVEFDVPRSIKLDFDSKGERLLQTVARSNNYSLNVLNSNSGEIAWSYEQSRATPAGTHGLFTPDGEQVISYGFGDGFRVVNAADGSLVRSLEVPTDILTSMAMSASGIVAAANRSGLVTLFDHREDEVVSSFRVAQRGFSDFAFTPDGDYLLTANRVLDGRQIIRLWHPRSSATVQTFLGGSGSIHNLSIHPLSEEFLLGGPNTRAWSIEGTKSKWTLLHAGGSNSVAFWRGEDQFFAPESGQRIGFWKLDDSGPTSLWKERTFSPRISVSRDRQHAVIASKGEPPLMSDSELDGAIQMKLPYNPTRIKLSPQGDRIATTRIDGWTLEVYEMASKSQSAMLENESFRNARDVGWLQDGRHLVGLVTASAARGNAGSEEKIVVWDVATGKILRTATHSTAMDVLTVAPDGKRFAEAGADKMVRIRDSESLAILQEFRVHNGAVTALAWHPLRPILATGSADRSVRLWNLETEQKLDEMRGFRSDLGDLAFSPSGQRLVGTTLIDDTRIWEPQSLKTESEGTSVDEVSSSEDADWFSDSNQSNEANVNADGWMDVLSTITPDYLDQNGNGWSLKNSKLLSPDAKHTTLPLSVDLSDVSYQVKVKLRALTGRKVFHLVLPIADRMCGFELDGNFGSGIYSGLILVNGVFGKNLPGAAKGRQVVDSEPHELELTVHLDGTDVIVTTRLDNRPLFEWAGPIESLSQHKSWATTESGFLALGTMGDNWEVSEVKVRRFSENGKNAPHVAK